MDVKTPPCNEIDRALMIQMIHRRQIILGDRNLTVTEQDLQSLQAEYGGL